MVSIHIYALHKDNLKLFFLRCIRLWKGGKGPGTPVYPHVAYMSAGLDEQDRGTLVREGRVVLGAPRHNKIVI